LDRIRLSEHLLVLRAQVGDEEAFADLFRRFGEKTHRYLVSLVGDSAADDVQQDVCRIQRISKVAWVVTFVTLLLYGTQVLIDAALRMSTVAGEGYPPSMLLAIALDTRFR
jgi:hypothetical protein